MDHRTPMNPSTKSQPIAVGDFVRSRPGAPQLAGQNWQTVQVVTVAGQYAKVRGTPAWGTKQNTVDVRIADLLAWGSKIEPEDT